MMNYNDLIFTASGIRGIAGKELDSEAARSIAVAFGSWLKKDNKEVIVGRDTRTSGEMLENSIIEGLTSVGCRVINVSICPTPIIIHAKNKLNIPSGIIISGSHNPPEWNGLKLLSKKTFLSKEELIEISDILNRIKPEYFDVEESRNVENLEPIDDYIQDLYDYLNINEFININKLKVVVDAGAGAGKLATPRILKGLGCEVKVINNDFDEFEHFPRGIEPIEMHLQGLINIIKSGDYDIGFAHDCDADRIAIIGDDGTCYPEDIGLALIARYSLEQCHEKKQNAIFVTNLASSLRFEKLAEKFGARVVRTPIGERYLAEKMDELLTPTKNGAKQIVFGGEGSCGGVMFPEFNNARDGIFAAAKIIEILVKTGEKISDLVGKLPKFYSHREKIDVKTVDISSLITRFKENLMRQEKDVTQVGLDLKISEENEWFVLIHPSNTEPIIRVITEASSKVKAKTLCNNIAKEIRKMISKMI